MEISHSAAHASHTRVILEPIADTPEMAERNKQALEMSRERAAKTAKETIHFLEQGGYDFGPDRRVSLRREIDRAKRAKVSIPPTAALPDGTNENRQPQRDLHIAVRNETTLIAAKRLVWAKRYRVLGLNFANATTPGGFLTGTRAQEENLVRSSALYATLLDDPMYRYHSDQPDHGLRATDWAILSPEIPIFRTDDGTLLPNPWPCAFITAAAPQGVRLPRDVDTSAIMRQRIHRTLAIARAYQYDALVLGAWGCGAFGCDPVAVAGHFRDALLSPEFLGAFAYVVFAVADWSP